MSGSPPGLRVLLTNVWLDGRGGTEAVIRDISQGLLRRGHRPIVYSPHLGPIANEIRDRGVAVVSDLAQVAEPPDVIHGQHLVQTSEAILRFPGTPAIQMCHAWQYWMEGPARFPEIYRYVAVDLTVRDRLVHQEQIEPGQVEVLFNGVDLSRIPPHGPLPERPRRALAFTKFADHLPLIRAACERHEIQLDVLGAGGGRFSAEPERELAKYDLVFATARMAIEAICCGCAVIVCDSRGLAGMATLHELMRYRLLNFGLRTLTRPISIETLSAEIAKYDAADAHALSERLRPEADFERVLDRLITLYGQALAAPRAEPEAHRAAMLRFVKETAPRERTHKRWPWLQERQLFLERIAELERELASARSAALGQRDPTNP